MVQPIRKPSNDPASLVEKGKGDLADLSGVTAGCAAKAVSSPARDLQRRIAASFSPVSRTWMSRYVTLLIMFSFAGALVSGVGTTTMV